MTQLIDDIHFRLPVFECISIIIPSLHTKNSARRHTIPMKLLWHLADMPTMFGKSWRSIVPFAFCTMRIFVIPRVRSVVCYQLCCTDIPCMCTGIASYLLMQSDYVSDRPPSGHERLSHLGRFISSATEGGSRWCLPPVCEQDVSKSCGCIPTIPGNRLSVWRAPID